MFYLFQFTSLSPITVTQEQIIIAPWLMWVLLGAVSIAILSSVLFMLRAVLRGKSERGKAFHRVVLQVMVPKERKSEGQGGQVGQEDRLEQIREEIGITETFFSSIAGVKPKQGISTWLTGRTDHFSFEIVAHSGQIYFYVDVPRRMEKFIVQQIHAQYPYAQIEEMTDYNIFTEKSVVVGAHLGPAEQNIFSFKTYKTMESDPLAGLLNVLAHVQDANSSVAVQYVVRSTDKRWRQKAVQVVREVKKGKKFEEVINTSTFSKFFSATTKTAKESFQTNKEREEGKEKMYELSEMETEMLKGIEQKVSKGGMDVTVRIVSASDQAEIAQLNLDNTINTFNQYNLYRYGNSFKAYIPRNQNKIIQQFIYRSFNEKRYLVLNTEELASIWHLPLHSTEAPNIKWLSGRTSPPPAELPKEGLHLGYVNYRGTKTEVYMQEADRRRHMYVIGKSGSGKSVELASLAIQDIQAGRGVCVVDPHGDLVEDILQHVPPERAEDVVIFDPSDLERPIGLNMLEAKSDDQKDFAVQEMIAIFYKLFPPEMIGPMFEHNMRNVMLTLMADINDSGTVIDIPRMFSDEEFAQQYVSKVKDPVVRAYWEKEMAKTSDFHKSEMLGYLISKLGRFAGNEMMRNIMGQQKSGFDFREIMDKKKILFVNLAKGRTGEVNAKLLGLIIVAKLQMAAFARADQPEAERHDFYLYIDEFQNFITDSISTILSEARKYRLDLILAHQYVGQLTSENGKTDVRDAVLGNVGTMMVGRIGPDDAELLAKEFAPVFGSYDLLNPPEYSFYTKLLINNKAAKPFSMQAYPPQKGNKELADAIKQLSRLKYGRDRQLVEMEIMERTQLGTPEVQGTTAAAEATL